MQDNNAFTRKKLLQYMPQNAVGAEIGVYKGDFSDLILEVCRPSELHLIDLFPCGQKVLSPSETGDQYLRYRRWGT